MQATTRNKNNSQGAVRSARGQALVEGAAIMPVMILFVVLLVFLLINTSVIGTYSYRLNSVAAEGARQITAGKWWLGMERPPDQIDEAKAQGDVADLIQAELIALGYKEAKASKPTFTYSKKRLTNGQVINIVRVDFDVTNLKIVAAGVFPATVSLHAYGIASDAEHAVANHGMALIHIVDPDNTNIQRAIRVPVYNVTIGNNTAADKKWLRAGNSIGTSPTATLKMYCQSSGLLKWVGPSGVTQTKAWGTPPATK